MPNWRFFAAFKAVLSKSDCRDLRYVLLLLFSFSCLSAYSAGSIEAVGLFKGRAMLKYQGETFLLREGETSKNGAHLIQANSRSALVSDGSRQYRLTLSDRVGGTFTPVSVQSISILQDELNQYRVRGSINRRSVNFLVDTGASIVAMSELDASAMGLDYLSSDQRGIVVTANGEANSYFVTLELLEVGGLRVQNVKAAVVEGSYPDEVLLGMSFLSKISMKNENGVLTLTQ